jgi:hypothetical protein
VGSISKKGGKRSIPNLGKNLLRRKDAVRRFHQRGYTQNILSISLNFLAKMKCENNLIL